MIHTIMKSGLTPMAEKQLNDNFRNLEREAENKGLQRQQSIIYLEGVIPSSYTEDKVNYQLTKRIFIPKNNKTTISVTTYCWGGSESYSVSIYVNNNYINVTAGANVNIDPQNPGTTKYDIVKRDITKYLKENDFNEIWFYYRDKISFDVEINATIITE